MKIAVRVFLLAGQDIRQETLLDVGDGCDIHHHSITLPGTDIPSELFVFKKPPRSPPSWTRFIESLWKDSQDLFVETETNSALLVVSVPFGSRTFLFALVFGRGGTALRGDRIVQGFGLRCALGALDPEMTTSLNHKQVDLTTFVTDQSASGQASFRSFGLDPDVQLLRGAAGHVSSNFSKEWATRAAGRDAFCANPDLTSHSILSFLQKLAELWEAKGYKVDYNWIDQVKEVQDPSARDRLLKKLYEELSKPIPKDVTLGPPISLPTTEIHTFQFGTSNPTGDIYTALSIHDYRSRVKTMRNSKSRSWQRRLKKDHLFLLDPNKRTNTKWSVFKCMSAKLSDAGPVILHEGAFYRVSRQFEERVDGELRRMLGSGICPTWPATCGVEAEYNQLLAASIPRSLVLDAKLISTYSGRSTIEVADVLSINGKKITLTHVKKYRGSSSLSHLFAQASVSSDAIALDPDFRRDIVKKWPNLALHFGTEFDPKHFEIRLCIATEGVARSGTSLPFFSKLSLVHRARAIRRQGFSVQVETVAFLK